MRAPTTPTVRSFHGTAAGSRKWQISTDGGTYPTWSRTKHDLFYGSANGEIMVAPFTVEDDSFRAEKPRLWSNGRFGVRGPNRPFDLRPDGKRFAITPGVQTEGAKEDHVTFFFNFFDELRGIGPLAKR